MFIDIDTKTMLTTFFEKKQCLSYLESPFVDCLKIICDSFTSNKKLLLCGNGGSSADCDHICGELGKSFEQKKALSSKFINALSQFELENADYLKENLVSGYKAISLANSTALITAMSNDVGSDLIFAQQLFSLGVPGDVLIAISTSGNSRNVVLAAETAKAMGIKVIAFTGPNECKLTQLSDVWIGVSGENTYTIQENHQKIYHLLCLCIENELLSIEI